MHTVPKASRASRERHLFPWIALLIAAIIFAGFARTYYLKSLFGTPALPALVHLHGLLMTVWVLVFVTQTGFIAAHRVDLHRRFGLVGLGLFFIVPVIGVLTAIEAARQGHTPGPPPLVFLAVPLFNMVGFVVLGGSALALRNRRSDWHKRLMLVATLNLLPPATARIALQYTTLPGLPFAYGTADLAIIACMIYDGVKHRRVHPAFVCGLLVVLAWEGASLAFSGTPAWMRIALWLTGRG
jgi:hypothetical protein